MADSSRAARSPSPSSSDVELLEQTTEENAQSLLDSSRKNEYYGETWEDMVTTFWRERYSSSRTLFGDRLQLSARARAFLVALLPSFYPLAPGRPNAAIRKANKTAWLDGLRGVASLIVMFHHSSWLWYPHLSQGWGSCAECYSFIQLPIIRIFYMGSAMVAIFFVVSGFSLSHRALRFIRKRQYPEALDALSSSTFRRGIRLLLPAITVTFFMMLATYFGFYGTGPGNRQPPRYDTFSQNLWHWWLTILDISDIFRPMNYPGWYNPPYDTNLWTIDVEFHGSLVIFLTLLGLAKVQRTFRLLVLIAIPLWLIYYTHTHLFLFMSGVFLAELHHIREDGLQPQNLEPSSSKISSQPRFLEELTPQLYWPRVNKAFWICNFIVALHVLSMPLISEGGESSPGFRTLAYYIPQSFRQPFIHDQFWIFLAAVHLVWSIDNATFLQSIFTTRFAQYLGKISFGLYLIHGTFLYTIGYNLSYKVHDYVGRDTRAQYTTGVILTVAFMYPLLFWTADIVYRHVDAKSVAFANWCYSKVSVGSR